MQIRQQITDLKATNILHAPAQIIRYLRSLLDHVLHYKFREIYSFSIEIENDL